MSKMAVKEKREEKLEKHMHDGHRNRLLSTVHEVGLDHLSQIQTLEFILFYIFPRGDVNPLAHRLLDRFESVANVLDASIHDLMRVKGMGETSAKKLHALLAIMDNYVLSKINSGSSVNKFSQFLKDIEILFRPKNVEVCYTFGITPGGEIKYGRNFSRGDIGMVNFDITQLTNYIQTYKMKFIIFVHNHPGGSCYPSAQDRSSNERIERVLRDCGVQLYDSLIVGRDGIFSCKANAVRVYFTQEENEGKSLQDCQQKKTTLPK